MASSEGTFTATGGSAAPSDTTQQLQNYWTRVLHEIKNLQPVRLYSHIKRNRQSNG